MSILELLSAVLLHTTFLWYLAACILVLPIFAHGAYDKIILGAWSIRMLKYIRPYIFFELRCIKRKNKVHALIVKDKDIFLV